MSILIFFLAGALGALIKDIVEEGEIVLPKKTDGRLSLGFLGGMAIGGIAGYLVDQNPITAFLTGYAGTSVIENMMLKKNGIEVPYQDLNEMLIRKIAKEELVDPDLAVRVAKCESNLNHNAVNINKDNSQDRGLFQINSKWHPKVSDDDAFDPTFSAKFFCKAFKNGNLSWWNATKKCWDK